MIVSRKQYQDEVKKHWSEKCKQLQAENKELKKDDSETERYPIGSMSAMRKEISQLEAKLDTETQGADKAEAENKRLRKAGQYLWQSLCDYGELGTPGATVFTPDQKFKDEVLDGWEQALKG